MIIKNDISDFKFANDNNNDDDNNNKEERAKKRAAKGKRRRGTAFTINNDKVADELYRAVDGNSNVEYMKVKYEPTNNKTYNYIETDKNTKNVFIGLKPGNNATSMTHSHPFTIDTQNNTYNSKYPSELDTNGYKLVSKIVKDRKKKMPNHYLYHPVSPDINKMPHTIEFNQNGAIEYKNGKPVNINNAALEANEALYRKTYLK